MKKKKHTNYLYMIDVDVKVTLYNNKLLRTNKYLKMKNFLLEISLKSRLIFFKKKKNNLKNYILLDQLKHKRVELTDNVNVYSTGIFAS